MTESNIIIGLDAKRIVCNGTGLGSFGRTLANDLGRLDLFDLKLYSPHPGRNELRNQVIKSPRVQFCYPKHAWGRAGRSLWRLKGIVKQLQRDGVQMYHGLSGELPIGLKKCNIRSVVTIHDLIFMRHPEYYQPIDVFIYQRKFRQALREADSIVAISECTKRDICQLGQIDESRIKVIYQSCATRYAEPTPTRKLWQVREKYDLPDRYVLSVGTIEERKNVLLAVQALPYLPEDVSLVIIGHRTPYADHVQQFIDTERLHQRVMMLHGIPNDDMPAFFRMADAFVYPSRYEGFGIPIIEAIRCGLPVVACTGSCLEEAGGPHNLYVAPDDVEGMAHALKQMLYGAQGREQRIARSQTYIERFGNSQATNHYAELYQDLCHRELTI